MFFALWLKYTAHRPNVNIVHIRSKLLYYLHYFKQNDMSGCDWICTSTSAMQVLQHFLLSDLKWPLSFLFILSQQWYWMLVFICFPFCTICGICILTTQPLLQLSWEVQMGFFFTSFLITGLNKCTRQTWRRKNTHSLFLSEAFPKRTQRAGAQPFFSLSSYPHPLPPSPHITYSARRRGSGSS